MATVGARDRARGSDVAPDPRIARGEARGRSRQHEVAARKARGEVPRSGTSFDLVDELDAAYESGRRSVREANDSSRAANRRIGYRAGQQDAQRTSSPTTPRNAPAPRPGGSGESPTSSTSTLRAPNLSTPGIGSTLDRTTSARIIVVAVALAGIGAVAHDAITSGTPTKSTMKVGNETITVPTHLHTLAGVVIVGTIALVANEFSPQVGLALGLLLLLDVGVNVFAGGTSLSKRIAGGIVNTPGGIVGGAQAGIAAGLPATGPVPSSNDKAGMQAWIAQHPGQLPHPGAGSNDFWNAIASGKVKG